MSESPLAYLPTDRRHALVRGADLAARTHGAALFADISGFTPLTEALVTALGPQRGAEALPIQLNRIYDALIACVDDYRGSVLVFSGDAITCWFDDSGDGGWSSLSGTPHPTAAQRATICALAMQRVMEQFATIAIPGMGDVSLAVKVAVAAGPVVRFLVGDPSIQTIDVLAGETLQRLARAEHQAERGDVILDEFAFVALGEPEAAFEWRIDDETSERFAVVVSIIAKVSADPWPVLFEGSLPNAQISEWLLPPVAARLLGGGGEFLTELRPAVSLFVRFGGIDYDDDPLAGAQLDAFVRRVQWLLDPYESFVLQLTIGDKGSYLNTSFGAPVAHGDDMARALRAALELRSIDDPVVNEMQIGVAHGRFRTGAYGGVSRRTYGVLGDEVNLAARLMQAAPMGEVLVDESVYRLAPQGFVWEAIEPFQVKGKSRLIQAHRLVGTTRREGFGLRQGEYALAMVGRLEEWRLVQRQLDMSLTGRGQVIGIVGEAGMGKSRLVAEIVRDARRRGMAAYGGECQSFGLDASYLVWQTIVRSAFGVDPSAPASDQRMAIERVVAAINPALVDRVPLLGVLFNLSIPDSELTASFDASLRKASLESMLIEVLRFQARRQPLLLVVEDGQWLDPLSLDLLISAARAIADVAVTVVVVYRPPEPTDRRLAPLKGLVNFTRVLLGDLPPDDLEALVHSKLRQLQGDDALPSPGLVEALTARAEGNPFYVEELLNLLHDRGIDAAGADPTALAALPDSLYSLILGRIDHLTEDQKTAIKVASVIGRLFRVAMLTGVYPPFAEREGLDVDLATLASLELTVLEVPEPELSYLFKHVLTQEVAYETLSFATRAMLHEQIGHFIEVAESGSVAANVDVLAHHFDRSDNMTKRKMYLRKAAVAAKATGANVSAANYLERVLPLFNDENAVADRVDVLLLLGQVYELTGAWPQAEAANLEVLELADRLADVGAATRARALANEALGVLERKRGAYPKSFERFALARLHFDKIGDVEGVSRLAAASGDVFRLQGRFSEAEASFAEGLRLASRIVDPQVRRGATANALKGSGTVASVQGDHASARSFWTQSMVIRREMDDAPSVAALLNNLAVVSRFLNEPDEAHRLNEESLVLWREVGDRWAVGQLLNNQACVASDLGNYEQARALLHESLAIRRQLGDRAGLALSLTTLAEIVIDQGDFGAAIAPLTESLEINRALEDGAGIAYVIEGFSAVSCGRTDFPESLKFAGFAAALRKSIGAPLAPAERARVDRLLRPAYDAVDEVAINGYVDEGAALGSTMDFDRLFGR